MEGSTKVIYFLRDSSQNLVTAWNTYFDKIKLINGEQRVVVSRGDIFRGAPNVDAIVSPANSFGFMDGGIDEYYITRFGSELEARLQTVIREDYNGELHVGNAVIVRTYESSTKERPIEFLISAPTMRIPMDIAKTVHAYQAFSAVILAVKKHNTTKGNKKIRSVLCPGLGTSIGRMPPVRCAYQMATAFKVHELGLEEDLVNPKTIKGAWAIHNYLAKY